MLIARCAVDDRSLTDALARLQGWRPGPDRFLKSGREWIRRSQFQPTADLQTAHDVLACVGAIYALNVQGGSNLATVRVGGRTARASNATPARALCLALVEALGLQQEAAT